MGSPTTTSSAPPRTHISAACRRSSPRPANAATSTRAATRASTASPTSSTSMQSARARPARMRPPDRDRQGRKLLLQAVRHTSSPLLEYYDAASRFHPAGDAPQRGDRVRAGRTARPLRLAHHLLVGHSRARRPQARDLCVARRAHQLPHRDRLGQSRPRRHARAVLAAGLHLDRQRHPALSRRLLARVSDGGRVPLRSNRRARLAPV